MPALNPTLPVSADPYISVLDYRQAPTGVDTQALVKGDAAATDAELLNRIRAASAWADSIMLRTIPATAQLDTELKRFALRPDMTITIAPRSNPCVQLVSLSYGTTPGNLAAMSDLSNVLPDPHFFEVPLTSGFYSSSGPLQFGTVRPGRAVYCQYSYIAGWPHTTLSSGVSAAANSLVVKDATGVQPGQSMTIYDGAQMEQVTVSSAYTSGTTLPLAAPTVFAHPAGVTVTALPDDIRQATILLTSTLIQTRGAVAVLAPQINALAGRLTQGGSGNSGVQRQVEFVDANVKTASDLLQRYQVWR